MKLLVSQRKTPGCFSIPDRGKKSEVILIILIDSSGQDGFISRLVGLVSAVSSSRFELLDCALQPFLMGRGEGPKLNTDAVPAGPAHNGALDENRGPSFMDEE